MASLARERRFPSFEKYEVLEELGHGGMATVYRAKDKRLGREVAIKVMHPHLRESAEIAHRFFIEAQAVAMLKHSNIVEVYDVSSEGEQDRYLVVELVRGKTLRKLLNEDEALPPEIAASLAVEILSALAHAHAEGVIHRDVKPENVLLELTKKEVEGRAEVHVRVKLTDFGIAKLLDAQGVTSTGQVLGSPAHMAPEQIEGGDVDARADLFGMGVLFYECMVGHLPFEGTNPAQVLRRVLEGRYSSAEHELPTIGRTWSKIVDHALASRAQDRFADAKTMQLEVIAELSRLGIESSRNELVRYFSNREGYCSHLASEIVPKLTELGSRARRKGDVAAAAADYNRALAYAPHDAKLLKVVSGMRQADRRARLVRTAIPMLLGGLGVGLATFFAVRAAVRHRPVPGTLAATTGSLESLASNEISPSAAPAASSAKASPTVAVRPTVAPKTALRSVSFPIVEPSFGVFVAVDGEPASEVKAGGKLTVDAKEHRLTFTCRENVCLPEQRSLLAGERDEPVSVQMKIRPASLVVIGEPSSKYKITTDSESFDDVREGARTEIRFDKSSAQQYVKVLETTGSLRSKMVSVSAGKEVQVSFDGP